MLFNDQPFKLDHAWIFDPLSAFFHNSRKYKSRILNCLRLFYVIVFGNYGIIHINGYYKRYILTTYLFKWLKNHKIFFTDHNPRLLEGKNRISKYLIVKFLENLDYLIVVGDHILNVYKQYNANLPTNVLVQNAFLPPPIEEENQIVQTYSQIIRNIMSNQHL